MRRVITVKCSVEECTRTRDSNRTAYCTRHRYLMDQYGTTDDPEFARACDHCGTEFWTTRRRARFCSVECRRAREKEDRVARNAARCRIWVGRCGICGTAFVSPTPDGHQVRMCSAECRSEAKRTRERIRERVREETRRQIYAESYMVNDARRRASLLSAAEMFSRTEIADRDGWICQLCGEPVDPSLEWPHPLSQSLDHKTPLSKGGTHTRENCQLAHLKCNLAKGDRVADPAA